MRSSKSASLAKVEKISTDNPDLVDRFNAVLRETADIMENSGIQYAFFGGIAISGLGRPRSTRDIDLFVRPEDAEGTLRILEKNGFRIERTDPAWIFKAFKDNIMVDIIFKSKGEIYLDQEMVRRMTTTEFHGRRIRIVSPEDLLIIKAVAHSELTPNHWHDAIALLFHISIDWEYLISRARRAPRRVLSLLLYAQSVDVSVPNFVIRSLYDSIFEQREAAPKPIPQPAAQAQEPPRPAQGAGPRPAPLRSREEHVVSLVEHRRAEREYNVGHLRERVAEDPRTHELDIRIEQEGEKILLSGRVCDPGRRAAVEQVVREACPGGEIENQIRTIEANEPTGTEVLP